MKVCIISHFGYPLYNEKCTSQFGGGSGVQLYLLSKELSKYENFEVFVLTGKYNGKKNFFESKGTIRLYKVLPFNRSIINNIKFLFNFFYYLYKINPDIVIQRAISITTGLAAIYCKIFKKKFLYSIANKPDVEDPVKKGLIYKIFRYGLRNADFIIAQNHEQMKLLSKLKYKSSLQALILKSGCHIRNKKEEAIDKSDILWVGRAVNWKRPELFLKLASIFKNRSFVMICTKYVNQGYWEDLKNLAEKISNLNFIEYVKFSEIDDYFKKATVYINTSVYEGFPNTFLQAFKYKTPVISLNVNPDYIFDKSDIGYYCNDNFDILKEKLSLLVENSAHQKMVGKNAYSYVSNFHDIEMIGKQWIKVFNFIMEKPNKG